MAEYNNQHVHPMLPETSHHTMEDKEAAQSTEEEKVNKRMKWAIYIAAFTVFQVMVILVFMLVIMKVNTPKFRIQKLQIQKLTTNISPPSLGMDFVATITVKNNLNFGPYKYDFTEVLFSYEGVEIGKVVVPKGKANFKSTKKMDMLVSIESGDLLGKTKVGTQLKSEGVVTLKGSGEMKGKVELMLLFKKKKTATMDCSMQINVTSLSLQYLTCK